MNLTIRQAFLRASATALSLVAAAAGAQTSAATEERSGAPTTQSAAPAASATPNAAPPRAHAHGGPRGEHAEQMFKRMDTDGDGKVSRAEFDAAQKAMAERAQRAFEAADTNRDGALSAEERAAFQKSMHNQMHAQGGHKPAAQ